MAGFLFFLSVICGWLAVHPFITYPLSLQLLRRPLARPLQNKADVSGLTYAVCMCAYREGAVILRKAENLRALQKAIPGLEVMIFIDNASQDNTAELLQPYASEFFIHPSQDWVGKTAGMNLLVSKVKADIIIFTDANVMLDVESIRALGRYYADPEVGCVCGHLIYVNGDGSETETSSNGSLYWKLEEKIKQLESETGSVMGADGSIFSIRRRLHQPPPADIIDDMYVSFSILCDGYRIIRAPDVVAYEESVPVAKEEFRRKVRITCQALNVHRLMWPRLRRLKGLDLYKYVSHKWLRWFVFYWLALSALFFCLSLVAAGWLWLALLLPVLAAVGLYAGNRWQVRPVPQLIDILYTFLATAVGIWRSFKGERFQTWTPAQSIRK